MVVCGLNALYKSSVPYAMQPCPAADVVYGLGAQPAKKSQGELGLDWTSTRRLAAPPLNPHRMGLLSAI